MAQKQQWNAFQNLTSNFLIVSHPVIFVIVIWCMYFKKILGYQESIDNKWWIRYDVALITLDSPFDISLPQINPICLPKPNMPFNMDGLYQEQLRIIGIAIWLEFM